MNVLTSALLALTEYGKGFEVQNRNTDMSVQYEFLNTVRRMKVTRSSLWKSAKFGDEYG